MWPWMRDHDDVSRRACPGRPKVAAALAACLLALALAPRPAAAGVGAAPPARGASARYVVQLADSPLAAPFGAADAGPEGPTDQNRYAAAAGTSRWSERAAHLDAQMRAFERQLASVAPAVAVQYHYRVAFDGVAVRLSEAQADAVRSMPGVVAVTREEAVTPLLDASLPQIAAIEAWADPRVGGRATAGRGVRLAVIDMGISPGHPMFDDAGFVAPPGFPRASVTTGDAVQEYGPADLATYTNNKVIVARAYVNPEAAAAAGQVTPLADGALGFHGEHVAGIAAGSVSWADTGGQGRQLSGVAPGAYVMSYKIADAYTPEVLRAIDDAVADGADVINASFGLSAMNVVDPRRHPISVAFENATAAGVVVAAAAGNAGQNGEATLGGPFQMIDDVITVGSVQTGRTFGTFVLASDRDLPPELARHPDRQFDMGNAWSRVEGPALASDLCNPIDLLRARDKVVLMPADAACDQSLIQLPVELPEQLKFLQQLLMARYAGAAGVVLYAATETEADQRALVLAGVDMAVAAGGDALSQFQLPITALVGGDQALRLVQWAGGHATLWLSFDRDAIAVPAPELVDAAATTSSRGPSATGPGVPPKPDLAAPGAEILSASTGTDGSPNGFAVASGTSMASPHVAGAAAVVRQVWPSWTPAQIKAALLTTADPVVTLDGVPAPTTVQGAGRLNLARALDPGLLVMPPSIGVAALTTDGGAAGQVLGLADSRRDPISDVVYSVRHEPEAGNQELVPVVPAQVVVPEGGSTTLRVGFRWGAAAPGTYGGWLVLESDLHTLRVFYQVVLRAPARDVLLLDVRRSAQAAGGPLELLAGPVITDTADYSQFWTGALDQAGLAYDVWTVSSTAHAGTPPLDVLHGHDLVLLAAGDGNAPLDQLPGGMTALQMYLLGGGRLVASGPNWDHGPPSLRVAAGLQTNGAMYFLSRYFAGFELTQDDVATAARLSAPADAPFSVLLEGRGVALAVTPGPEAAPNGGAIDLGRPLAALDTASRGALQTPIDLGIAAPVAVDAVMPYMRVALAVGSGPSAPAAMTTVTADATLENPRRADFIPWRAAFAGFPFEAVAPSGSTLSRAGLLDALHRWAVEPADVTVSVAGPRVAAPDQTLRLTASARSATGIEVSRWRWDDGTDSPYQTTAGPEIAVSYHRVGSYVVRAEATTSGGHTYVGGAAIRVGGVYLPVASVAGGSP